jgi:hypothetical protein
LCLALALLLPAIGPAVARAAGTYYVDRSSPNCSDTGPGSEAQPYCTIAAAVSARGGPGTTLLVKPGVYREQVTVGASGAAGSPLVLRAPEGGVTVDGADDLAGTAGWQPSAGDAWVAAAVTWAPLQVFADGARLTPSMAAPGSLPEGAFTWVSGQGLYVNVGGGNPGARDIRVGRRLHGFRVSGRTHVTIEGFEVTRTEDRGIYLLNGCASVTLADNVVSYANRMGIQVVGGSGHRIERNRTSDGNDHGIALTAGATASQVRDNESFLNSNPAVRAANGIHLYEAPGNLLERNRLHHNQDTGLHLAGGSNDCVSLQNMSWSNGDHGFDHLFSSGTLNVGNVSFANHMDGFSIEGNASGTRIFNCLAVDNGLTTDRFDLWVDPGSTIGFASDHNLFWNSTGTAPFKYIATIHPSIEGYRAASGQDAHSLQSDPRFVDAAAGDFHLLAGSPAIDAGDSGVPDWPVTDAEGRARADDPATPNTGAGPIAYADRGALEFVPAADQPPVVTVAPAAGGAEGQPLSLIVGAADPDGDPIASLTASGLPPGAGFVADPGNTSGTLSWTPGFDQAGPHTVIFTATNAGSGTASTIITVADVDRPPTAGAPAAMAGVEGGSITVLVTASDPDGDPITSLTAVISQTSVPNRPPGGGPGPGTIAGAEDDVGVLAAAGLPEGATFEPGPDNTTGTLTWATGYEQAGGYTVRFVAANAASGFATTTITVRNTDRRPVVTAPAAATTTIDQAVTVSVTASDPDGDAITVLAASGLPPGASFIPGPWNTSGTLSWTPVAGDPDSATVTFTAANAKVGSTSTVITVQHLVVAPVASLVVSPVTGNAPLAVTADAGGSSDPDGSIASYRFDFGDGTVVGPQPSPVASHAYGAGSWTATVTVTDDDGATHAASQSLLVAAVPPGSNLVGNPSFEVDTAGWSASAGASLARVAGGFDGAFALRVTGPAGGTGSFQADDTPNWVASTTAAGVTYRFTAWVKASSGAGSVRLRVREYVGGNTSGGPRQSGSLTLSSAWQPVTLDVVSRNAGSTLDFWIVCTPTGPGQSFLADNVAIRQVGADPPATGASGDAPPADAADPGAVTGDERTGLVPSLVRARATLSFRMAERGPLEVDLLDLAGRRVRRLARAADAPAGPYRLAVDGRGDRGERLPAGVYFYRIVMPDRLETGRFVVLP